MKSYKETIESIGDDHVATSLETPLRKGAFALDDDMKIELIQNHFREIMNILGLDLNDDSLSGTPYRVAKMYVKEIFGGLIPANKPSTKLFENKYNYNKMMIEKNKSYRAFKNQQAGAILCQATTGTGKTDQPDSRSSERSIAHGRCCRNY
jgi:GTP cyclohydrolase I